MKTIYLPALVTALVVEASASTATANTGGVASDLEALVQDVRESSARLNDVDAEKEELSGRIERWAEAKEVHNGHPCIYPQGYPEQCAAYDAEKAALESQRASLQQEYNDIYARRQALLFRIHNDLARIRVAHIAANLRGLEAWVRRVRTCATLPEAAAAGCLNDAWEEHP